MCNLRERLDEEHKRRVDSIYNRIAERIENSKNNKEYSGVAFSTINFPKLYGIWLEPRMPLQIPSNFYQSVLVDGQKLRNDWTSGWLRVISFQEDSLFLLAHGLVKKEDKEYNLFLYQVEFKRGEFALSKTENKFVVSVENVSKEGIDLITGEKSKHSFSFSFVHQPTEKSFVPRDRVESSGLFKSIYQGKIAPKPIAFDWSNYVITVPHFAFHSIIHQRYKEFGFNSAIEMQHKVTECLISIL
ncbi:MAG: hypothetical protein NZ903_00240 [Candidatus Micrarchaeota archaeon]|nr:hypothetical protein [Candidatus Micrarchaeota archaeon]